MFQDYVTIEELIWKYVSLTKGTSFNDQALIMKASSVLVRTETGHSQGIFWKVLCWKFLWIGLRFACLFITEFDWNLKIIFIAKALSQKLPKVMIHDDKIVSQVKESKDFFLWLRKNLDYDSNMPYLQPYACTIKFSRVPGNRGSTL